MKVLVDTNIWVSLFLGSERLTEIIEDSYSRHQILTSKGIIHELETTLTKKLSYTSSEIELALVFVRRRSHVVEETVHVVKVCRDPADNHVLSAGLSGNADCILTGDRDLLVLKQFQKIFIISPKQFRDFEENLRIS